MVSSVPCGPFRPGLWPEPGLKDPQGTELTCSPHLQGLVKPLAGKYKDHLTTLPVQIAVLHTQ